MIEDVGYIFIYVSSFGLSDYIVNHFKLKGEKILIYNFTIFLLGLVIIYYHKQKSHKEKNDTLL